MWIKARARHPGYRVSMKKTRRILSRAAALVFALGVVPVLSAHCDTLDGPVVVDAREAIAIGKVDAALKWVRSNDEAEVRAAFERTLAVRSLSPQAATLADRWFFENLVRIHRAAEGASYDGLKAEAATDSGIDAADRALASGDVSLLVDQATHQVVAGLTERFERVREAAKHRDHTVEAGRAFVVAYVDFVHYAESVLSGSRLSTVGASAHHAH